MSTTAVITILIIAMAILIFYALINQFLQNKREQENRFIKALKKRVATFKYMNNCFPAGFLSSDLDMLITRTVADVSEQLASIEPNNPNHLNDFQEASSKLSDGSLTHKADDMPRLETPQQVQEVSLCLEELHKNIVRLAQSGAITVADAENYRQQIRSLLLKAKVDNASNEAEKAAFAQKDKLALHHYQIAVGLLEKYDKDNRYGQLNDRLSEKKNKLAEKLDESAESETSEKPATEWDNMSTGEDLWKKKNIYD